MGAPRVAGVVALMWDKDDDNTGTLSPGAARTILAASVTRFGAAPLDSPVNGYSFDGVRDGILSASGALGRVQ